MNTHEFDDIIRRKAQQREAAIPDDLWDGISNEKKRRRFPFFWFILTVLLVGGGVIVWNLNSKSKPVETAATQDGEHQTPNRNNKTSGDKDVYVPTSDKDDKKKSTTVDVPVNSVAGSKTINTNSLPSMSNVNDIKYSTSGKEDVVSNEPKKHTGKNKFANNQNGDQTYQSTKNKRKINGNKNVSITGGELGDDNNIAVTDQEEVASTNRNELNNQANLKVNIAGGETGEDADKHIASTNNENTVMIDKKDEPSEIVVSKDSLADSKKIIAIVDSPDHKTKIALPGLKSPNKNNKISSWKIEAGITVMATNQHYTQPLYVKRSLDQTNIHSEFISENIKTSIEPGSGFNINLVKTLNKKWSIGGGVQYIRFTERIQMSGIETNYNYTIVQRVVHDQTGSFLKTDTVSAITKDRTTLTGRNIYHNISIPLFVRYSIIERKKWSATLTGGTYIDLLRKYHNDLPGQFITMYNYGSESSESKNTIGFDLFAGLHFTGRLSRKYELFAEPAFRYNVSAYKTHSLSFNKKINKSTFSIGIARNF